MVSLNGKIKDVYYVMEIYAQSYIDIHESYNFCRSLSLSLSFEIRIKLTTKCYFI